MPENSVNLIVVKLLKHIFILNFFKMKKNILFIFLLYVSFVSGQKLKDSVKTEVIEVTRSFEPKVQDAYKININPQINPLPEKKIPVEFNIQSVPVASTFQPEKGAMAGFNPGSLIEKTYKNYTALAVGNYWQVQADAFLYYPLSQGLSAGLQFQHYSSQGQKTQNAQYEAFYNTTLTGLFDYQNKQNLWHFELGYDGHLNYLKQDPNIILLNPPQIYSLKNTDNNFYLLINGQFKETIFKNMLLHYNNYWNGFDNSEHLIHFKTFLLFPFGTLGLKIGIQSDLVTGNTGHIAFADPAIRYALNYNNADIGLLPAIRLKNDHLTANLGAKIFYQNNVSFNRFQFIPDIKVNLNLIYEKLSVFAGVTGDLTQNSQFDLTRKNPYLALTQSLRPSLTPYDIFGGFNGAFSSSFSYAVTMGYRYIKQKAFYNYKPVNMPVGSYDIVYDNLAQSYFKTAFNIGVGKKLDLKLNLTYFQNNPDHLKKALFIPDFDFQSVFIFHPTNRLSFDMTLNSAGKRFFQDGNDNYLKAYTDLNIGVRYKVNKQFTGFLKAYNVLNRNYQIYYLYPVQRLQILGGVAYRFDFPPKN